jgi:hypothetical protein
VRHGALVPTRLEEAALVFLHGRGRMYIGQPGDTPTRRSLQQLCPLQAELSAQ